MNYLKITVHVTVFNMSFINNYVSYYVATIFFVIRYFNITIILISELT